MFAIELGEGSVSLQADKRGRRSPRTPPHPGPRGRPPARRDRRHRRRQRRHRSRRARRRPALPDRIGRHVAARGERSGRRRCRLGRRRHQRDRRGGRTIKTVSGDVELRAGTLTTLDATTTSGDLRIAGRLAGPGPFAIVTVSGDTLLAPAGDLRIEMATLSGDIRSKVGGRTEGGRGRRSLSSVPADRWSASARCRATSWSSRRRPSSPGRSRNGRDGGGHAPEPRPRPSTPEPAVTPNPAIAAAYDDARLRILRSLERGEIDVAEAGQRLEALDGIDPLTTSGADRRETTAEQRRRRCRRRRHRDRPLRPQRND